jgi:hypothetical protein
MESAREARDSEWSPPIEELAQGQRAEAGSTEVAP